MKRALIYKLVNLGEHLNKTINAAQLLTDIIGKGNFTDEQRKLLQSTMTLLYDHQADIHDEMDTYIS